MAINNNPIFPGIPSGETKNISTANTSNAVVASPADGESFRLLFTAGGNGGFVSQIDYQAIGTGTPEATLLNVWLTDTNGKNAMVVRTITVAAGSAMSATTAGVYGSIFLPGYELAPGRAMYVSFTALAANVTYNVSALNTGQYSEQ